MAVYVDERDDANGAEQDRVLTRRRSRSRLSPYESRFIERLTLSGP